MVEYPERRQAPRVPLTWRLAARARASLDVQLLDLSLTGARIEHTDLLRPGAVCAFELPSQLGSLALSTRIVWSHVIGGEHTEEGERRLRYQSGLVFVAVTPEQQAALGSTLERLTGGPGSL
jgi:hypothetical protein